MVEFPEKLRVRFNMQEIYWEREGAFSGRKRSRTRHWRS